MRPLTSPAEVEFRTLPRRRWRIAGAFAVFAILVGALGVLGAAFALQAEKVDDLETQNQRILSDHKTIGAAFTKQTLKLAQTSRKLDMAVRRSFDQGFVAGQQALSIPPALRVLARLAAIGILVPRQISPALEPTRPSIEADVTGYTVRWRQLAIFASKLDPLRVWTRQSLGGVERLRLGKHRVSRLLGPSGVIYAWREQGTTYAVISSPRLDAVARYLIASMR
jgi:nitrogen fixation-related uncharacterized protein